MDATEERAPNLTIMVHDAETGDLLRTIRTHNLITDHALQRIIDLAMIGAPFLGLSVGSPTWGGASIALGTDGSPTTPNQLILVNEVFRNVYTTSLRSGNVWTITYYLSSTQANGYTLQEYGEFTDPVGGLMLARATFPPIAKDSSKTVTFVHTITLSAS